MWAKKGLRAAVKTREACPTMLCSGEGRRRKIDLPKIINVLSSLARSRCS